VNNTICNRKILTQRIRIANSEARSIQNLKFWDELLTIVVLTGIFTLSPVVSSLMKSVVIYNSGQISATTVLAKSGHWRDIQDAVDQAATYGKANVRIPEGTFNFVNVGESWTGARVIVPAGINIFGASTERTKGQVVEWKTVLQIPWEAAPRRPNYITMFKFQGNGDPNKPSRFSDIEVVGYREFEPTSDRWYAVVQIRNIIDFRVDHCFFKNTAGMAVEVRAPANRYCCGVIDHCRFINDYGYVEWDYAECSVHYAIMIRAVGTTRWEDNIDNVIGKYLPYTVFIEDCYFSRWRHCVSSNDGTHYVFRHNIIEKDCVVGSLDGHGTYDNVGTRAMEIYDNLIIDPVVSKHPKNWNNTAPAYQEGYGVNWRGGGGVFFNNLVRLYEVGLYLTNEGTVEKCYPHDIYIWNNTFTNCQYTLLAAIGGGTKPPQEGVDYFFYAKLGYTPYLYPHPLTLENP
jgi:hypothetical protein